MSRELIRAMAKALPISILGLSMSVHAGKPVLDKTDAGLSALSEMVNSVDSSTQSAGSKAARKGASVQSSQASRLTRDFGYVINGKVTIDAISNGQTDDLKAKLVQLGMENPVSFGNVVSGAIPVTAISELQNISSLKHALPAMATTNVGLVTSEADVTLRADIVKSKFNIDGSGVKVGVLSDSFNCRDGADTDVANNDLPAGIEVLEELAPPEGAENCTGSDEGRAMMQLIHDVAPGTSQAFHTAFGGQADFAQGIIELQEAGADVIVDDVFYFAEPMFQDGILAQAVDTVVAAGATYYSSAGNSGRDSWEGSFDNSGQIGQFGQGAFHDFNPDPDIVDTRQTIILEPGSNLFVFQWASPYASANGGSGATSDLDLILFDGGVPIISLSGDSANIGGDPIEIIGLTLNGTTPLEVEFGISLYEGDEPQLMKYNIYNGGIVAEYATNSSTVVGHSNAANAIAVGASAYFNHPLFNDNVDAPIINGFSSAGNTPILFDLDDNPVFELRQRPQVVGPDGTNTTFFGGDFEPDGFPNFFGTSAAAPHVAAVAAMMLQTNPSITHDEILDLMIQTATDMDDPITDGFDFGYDEKTGYGYVNADSAVELAGTGDKSHKYFICKKGRTMSVGKPSLQSHLKKGAKFGPCN